MRSYIVSGEKIAAFFFFDKLQNVPGALDEKIFNLLKVIKQQIFLQDTDGISNL